MKETKYKFTKREIKDEINRYKQKGLTKTAEEVLEIWAYRNYPLANDCSYFIKRIGKTFIIIGEHD